MTSLLALLALLQSAPVAEKSGLFEYKRPAGWQGQDRPDGGRSLLPPDGSGAIVRFLQPEPWAGTPEAYHEAVHAKVRQAAPLRSGAKPEPFGGFLRSEAEVGASGGPAVWILVYTAKAGDRFQAVLYAAPSAAAFARHREAVDGLVRAIELPPARERVSGFEVSLPRGWKRQDDAAQGTTSMSPAELAPGPVCGVLVLRARESAASADEHHEQMWTALTANGTPIGKPARSELGLFTSSRAAMRTAQGQAWLILYTAKRGAVAEALFFAASLEAHYEKYGVEADRLVAGIAFPAAAPAVPGARAPRPIPAAGRDVKLLGLWVNGASKVEYGMDFNGGFSAQMRSSLQVLALWENGLAYRGAWNAPVFLDNGAFGVPEGLAAVDAAALAAQAKVEDTRFGRWTEKAGVVDVPENWHGAMKLTREGPNFVNADGGKWIRFAPVDGLKLDGTYVGAATAAAPEMRLTLRKDGGFEAVNLVHTLGGPTHNPGFPMQGKGTYELRKWSLILRFEGGYTQAVAFLSQGEGLADAKKFVFGGSEFVRR